MTTDVKALGQTWVYLKDGRSHTRLHLTCGWVSSKTDIKGATKATFWHIEWS